MEMMKMKIIFLTKKKLKTIKKKIMNYFMMKMPLMRI
jgi:hypothetical protein